jgi:hypothetical protein
MNWPLTLDISWSNVCVCVFVGVCAYGNKIIFSCHMSQKRDEFLNQCVCVCVCVCVWARARASYFSALVGVVIVHYPFLLFPSFFAPLSLFLRSLRSSFSWMCGDCYMRVFDGSFDVLISRVGRSKLLHWCQEWKDLSPTGWRLPISSDVLKRSPCVHVYFPLHSMYAICRK